MSEDIKVFKPHPDQVGGGVPKKAAAQVPPAAVAPSGVTVFRRAVLAQVGEAEQLVEMPEDEQPATFGNSPEEQQKRSEAAAAPVAEANPAAAELPAAPIPVAAPVSPVPADVPADPAPVPVAVAPVAAPAALPVSPPVEPSSALPVGSSVGQTAGVNPAAAGGSAASEQPSLPG